MRYVAIRRGYPDPGRIESIGQDRVVQRAEFEARDREHAEDICLLRGWIFFAALGDPGWKPTKENVFNGHTCKWELVPGIGYRRKPSDG